MKEKSFILKMVDLLREHPTIPPSDIPYTPKEPVIGIPMEFKWKNILVIFPCPDVSIDIDVDLFVP